MTSGDARLVDQDPSRLVTQSEVVLALPPVARLERERVTEVSKPASFASEVT